MASNTVSSLFPDRPIRPLPKRRLRERLSPEVADSIQYPHAPQTLTPLFPYLYVREEERDSSFTLSRERATELEPRFSPRNGLGIEVEPVDAALLRNLPGRAAPDSSGRSTRPTTKTDHGRHGASQPPLSAASSVDGYDSFEYANNKKKRKIPTAGDSALNGIHVIDTGAGAGAGSQSSVSQFIEGQGETSAETSTAQSGPGGFVSGIQNVPGPGRGRYGRPRSGRSPLRPLMDSTNSWAGRNGKLRSGQWMLGSSENTGIISNAIANAEKLPPHQGQENISLLHQPISNKPSPASTQFTFTCESPAIPGPFSWSSSDRRASIQNHQIPTTRSQNDNWPRGPQATQAGQTTAAPRVTDSAPKETLSRGGINDQSQPAAAPKSTRRSAAKEYNAAAKARRRETQLYNKRHPPKPEEIWICHFCEYESIFGHPPEALVRQYEMKDRKQRQVEQLRKAQWERLKKGKHKGKKNSKVPVKANDATQDPNRAADGHAAPMNGRYSQGTQSEEYYDDEDYEDEDYDPGEDTPPEEVPDIPDRRGGTATRPSRIPTVHDGGDT
ncbi:hypothetical protein B0T17DRAFT_490621 [Bombardia bombarda]|uniref:Uncharacterized protein n=1 Tax=Bombardia bombarda TaxID=252184 RepID=A0AA39X8D7_9PEZI|nr:hypothetical protein B0T17DRAFT_490621 [Bombardia bombarda]